MMLSQICVSMLSLSGSTIKTVIAQTCFIFPITLKNNRRGDKKLFSIRFLKSVVASDRWKEGLYWNSSLQYLFAYSIAGIWRGLLPGKDSCHKMANNCLQLYTASTSITLHSFHKHFAKWWALVTMASHWRPQAAYQQTLEINSI